jgi:hypothetical protein
MFRYGDFYLFLCGLFVFAVLFYLFIHSDFSHELGHGYCSAGACVCDNNWISLSDCSLYIRSIDFIPYTGSDDIGIDGFSFTILIYLFLGIREWRYYTVTEPLNSPFFSFSVTMDSLRPLNSFKLLLYLAFDVLPNRYSSSTLLSDFSFVEFGMTCLILVDIRITVAH